MLNDVDIENSKLLEPFFTFEMEGMLRYFSLFDPIEYRYSIEETFKKRKQDMCDTLWGNKERVILLEEQQRQIYGLIARYEESHSQIENIGADSSDILKNLRLIYGESEPIKDYIRVYEIVQRKLISGYLQIEGLSNLFHQKYFEFEWAQHTGLNYKSHRQSYYRDHFIHQAKDTYEAMRFLVKMPSLQDTIINAFIEDNTVVADYIQKAVTGEYSAVSGEPDAKVIYQNLYGSEFDFSVPFPDESKSLAHRHIYKNIIKSAMIMAGLFHDIGYPIQYVNDNKDQLSEFLPTARFFFDPAVHWDDMLGKLSDSLLRKIVPYDRLKDALDAQLHGTLSAMAFLLYFYENGSIYNLRPAKRAAVELAALAMADHTNRFTILKHKDAGYYRMTSFRNPLSFLLRFCDDIQEWGRTYFLVSSHDSVRFCSKCRLPIISCEYLHGETRMRRNLCGCSAAGATEKGGSTYYYTQLENGNHNEGDGTSSSTGVLSRQLNHISISERVRVFRVATHHNFENEEYYLDFLPGYENDLIRQGNDVRNAGDREADIIQVNRYTSDREAYIIQVDYTLSRLLHIAYFEPEFARYQAETLNRLKTLLNDNKNFPTTLIYSDISTNPITLKVKILERFMTNLHSRFMISCSLAGEPVEDLEQQLTILRSFVTRLKRRGNGLDDKIKNILDYIPIVSEENTNEERKIRDDRIKELINAIQIDMLLFSNKRFTISEIVNTKYAAIKRIDKESHDSGQDGQTDQNSVFLNELLKLWKSKTMEKDFVGLAREDYCRFAVAVYNRLRELFDIGNQDDSSPSKQLNSLLESVRVKCSDDIIRNCAEDEVAVYDNVSGELSGFNADSVKNIVNDSKTVDLTGQFCDKLMNQMMEQTGNTENVNKIKENLLLYFRMLTASKLFLLARKKADEYISEETAEIADINMKAEIEVKAELRAKVFIKYVLESVITYFSEKEKLIKSFANEYSGDKSLEILIRDFFKQESRHITYYEHALKNKPLPKEYYEIYTQPGEVAKAIAQYTDPNNYKNAIYKSGKHFESHIDLYVFTRMAHAVQ